MGNSILCYENLLNEIEETDFLKKVFFLSSKSKDDFVEFFNDDNEKMEKYNDINWLYVSKINSVGLIGITENKTVFSIGHDLSQGMLSESLYEVPFILMRCWLSGLNDSQIKTALKSNTLRQLKYIDLEKYVSWCENRNFLLSKDSLSFVRS